MHSVLDIYYAYVEAEWIAYASLEDIKWLKDRPCEAKRDGLVDMHFGSPSLHENSNHACDETNDLWIAEHHFSGYYDMNDPETAKYFAGVENA